MNTHRTEAEVPGFRASPALTAHLQTVLVVLVDFAREGSDTIAERKRALNAVPDGRSDTIAADTTLAQFPAYEHDTTAVVALITERTYAAVGTMRAVHDAVDAEDPSTAALLHALIDGVEKLCGPISTPRPGAGRGVDVNFEPLLGGTVRRAAQQNCAYDSHSGGLPPAHCGGSTSAAPSTRRTNSPSPACSTTP